MLMLPVSMAPIKSIHFRLDGPLRRPFNYRHDQPIEPWQSCAECVETDTDRRKLLTRRREDAKESAEEFQITSHSYRENCLRGTDQFNDSAG